MDPPPSATSTFKGDREISHQPSASTWYPPIQHLTITPTPNYPLHPPSQAQPHPPAQVTFPAEVNRVEVQNPRRWGATPTTSTIPLPLSVSPAPGSDHGGWDVGTSKDPEIGRWVETVAPISPPTSPTHSATAPSSPQAHPVDLPPRPDSARPIALRKTVYVSDDESTPSPGPITPQLADKQVKAPKISGEDAEQASSWHSPNTSGDIAPPAPRQRRRMSNHTQGSFHTRERPPYWWKDQHPVTTPHLAHQRLFVQ